MLAQHDRQPAIRLEQLARCQDDARGRPEVIDAVAQTIRHRHIAAVAPERGIVAFGGLVMQDDEITDRLVLVCHGAVILFGQQRIEGLARPKIEQFHQARLNQVNAGRFERLQEPAGEADGHDITVPAQFAATGGEAQELRIGQGLAVEVGQQRFRRFLFRCEIRAEDMTVAGAVLERNTPLPAGRMGGGARIGRDIARLFAGYEGGAVAWQYGAPVVKAALQGLFDQQGGQPRTVDKEVTADGLAAFQGQGLDKPGFGIL